MRSSVKLASAVATVLVWSPLALANPFNEPLFGYIAQIFKQGQSPVVVSGKGSNGRDCSVTIFSKGGGHLHATVQSWETEENGKGTAFEKNVPKAYSMVVVPGQDDDGTKVTLTNKAIIVNQVGTFSNSQVTLEFSNSAQFSRESLKSVRIESWYVGTPSLGYTCKATSPQVSSK